MSVVRRSQTKKGPKIGVCGAGIAGLALATRLARLGFHVTVLEAREEAVLETESVPLSLSPNGMNGLRAIDLQAEVIGLGIGTTAIEILDELGLTLAQLDQSDHEAAFGAQSIFLQRSRLTASLLRKAQSSGAEMHFGHRLVALDQEDDGVRAKTDQGNELYFDLLAACDGLFSRVRELVFPEFPTPRFSGLVATGGLVDAPGVPATHGTLRMLFGRHALFGYIKAIDQPVLWFNSYPAEFLQRDPSTPQAYASFLRTLHRTDPWEIREILAAVSEVEHRYPIFSLPELPVWHRDRVVLVGDAAHALSPHAGHGASLAIEDAIVLSACLEAEALPGTAFARFEALRRARVREVMPLSVRNGSQKRTNRWLGLTICNLILPIMVSLGTAAARRNFAYQVDRDPLALPAP
jgi:2-polyprenyl-6-methoxyphenol hydroxylase-like FAD-dependent oxidoreductase